MTTTILELFHDQHPRKYGTGPRSILVGKPEIQKLEKSGRKVAEF